jgi:hypothetical protein
MSTYFLSAPGFEGTMVDENGNAFACLGVRHAAQYLVRPDGYIAFRCAGPTFNALERYVAVWYVPST